MYKCQSFWKCFLEASIKEKWIYYCIWCFIKKRPIHFWYSKYYNLNKIWCLWLSYKTEDTEYIYKNTDKTIFSYENIIKKYNKKIF